MTLLKASVLLFARDADFLGGYAVLAAKVEVVVTVTFIVAGGMSTRIAVVTVAATATAGAFTVVASHRDFVSRIIMLMMACVLIRGTVLALVARVLAALGSSVFAWGVQLAVLSI